MGDRLYRFMEEKDGYIDRAMNKVKELCEDPNGGCVFWSAGAQPPELLVAGEVVMATGWNGRFFNAEIGEGAPIKQVWDGQGPLKRLKKHHRSTNLSTINQVIDVTLALILIT